MIAVSSIFYSKKVLNFIGKNFFLPFFSCVSPDEVTENHMLCDIILATSIPDVRAMRGVNIDCDHHLVRARVQAVEYLQKGKVTMCKANSTPMPCFKHQQSKDILVS